MKIVCAASIYLGEEAFSTLGETTVVPDNDLGPAALREADLLITRTRRRVDESLLAGTPVSFVGTATAGFDHLDVNYLGERGIAWCSAPGCNADSVGDYVVAALLYLGQRHSLVLEDLTLGVVGVGNAGSRVAARAEAMGMRVLRNDPPLQKATGDPIYVPLDEVLAGADVLTLHVPLVTHRPWPTLHMGNHRFFSAAKPGAIFINAARGDAVMTDALIASLDYGQLSAAVVDVWEQEPYYSAELLRRADLGTPHIAGHSLEGKLNGTVAVYREAAHFLEMEPTWTPSELPRGRGARELDVDTAGRTDEEVLADIVRQVYDIAVDDRNMRASVAMDRAQRGEHFLHSRKEYPVRREFSAIRVTARGAGPTLQRKITGLGFELVVC